MRPAVVALCLAVLARDSNVLHRNGNGFRTWKLFEGNNYEDAWSQPRRHVVTGKIGNYVFDGVFQNGHIEGAVKVNLRSTV